jgi:hypothetical protein
MRYYGQEENSEGTKGEQSQKQVKTKMRQDRREAEKL